MKFHAAVALLLAGLLTASRAAAQNPVAPSGGEESQKGDQKDPLFFVKIAADVAANVHPDYPLNGYVGLYIDQQSWASALKDGDLGRFVKAKKAKPGRSAACLFSSAKDVAVCVFFDGEIPFGVIAVKAGASGKIEAGDVAAAYEPVTKEMLQKPNRELDFEPAGVRTDNGTPLPGFMVSTAAKVPS